MSKLYIFTYNNYYNRIIKKENNLSDYGTPVYTIENFMNFNPNDGVNTSHVVGTFDYNGNGDYAIITDNEDNILSHWFILEAKRTRKGQYNLQLRRDIIIDYYENVIVAPMIVNRAMVSNVDSPLLFNSEGFSFNQIKTNEILLKDVTQMPWYVLYFKLNTPQMSISFSNADISWDVDSSIDVTSENSEWKSGTYKYVDGYKLDVNFYSTHAGYIDQFEIFDRILKETPQPLGTSAEDWIWFDDDRWTVADKLGAAFTPVLSDVETNIKAQYGLSAAKDNTWFNDVNKWNGKTFILRTIVQSVVNYYKVTVNVSKAVKHNYVNDSSNLFTYLTGVIDDNNIPYSYDIDDLAYEYTFNEYTIIVNTESYNVTGSYGFTLNLANYASCANAPYYIMAIPMYELDVESSGGMHCISKQLDSQMLVNAIIKAAGETNLLDAQVLPYFPYISKFPEGYIFWEPSSKYIEMDNFVQTGDVIADLLSHKQYARIYRSGAGEENYGVNMFFIDNDSFTFNIEETLSIPNRTANAALNKKLSNEVDIYRLCSPNYNGQFEFSVAKNNGVDYFNVDVTLRPYNPYIHINPNFKSIYGQDFNDSRGLICQGDFSIPIVNDPWIQYEYQNKNYLNIFNRQIEHMEFQQGQERIQAGWNIAAGSVSGVAMGALAGSKFGGVAAGVGAAVGGLTSLAGGIIDYSMLGERQREDKEFAIDNFRYQLGNIKALPYSINKVTPLTFNNKLWPFLEYYTATDDEINILNNKILYNSMTVNAVGSIMEYKQDTRTFISGDLIRLENTGLANNELYAIYDELRKGVYI